MASTARIVFTTIGSRGDLHPLLAVAAILRRRGHHVQFALESSLAAVARTVGFPVTDLPGSPDALRPYAREVFGGRSGLRSLSISFRQYIVPTLSDKVPPLVRLLADAHVLVAPPVHPAAVIASEVGRVPWVSVSITPAIASAWIDPIPYAAPMPDGLRRALNRTLWTLAGKVLRQTTDPAVNRVRARWGLPPVRDALSAAPARASRNLVAVSPAFVPRPPDWSGRLQMTGFAWWDEDAGEELPLKIDQGGGRPAVAVVGGSAVDLAGPLAPRFFADAVRAVHRIGGRPVVVGAPADPSWATEAGNPVTVPYVPFSQLFSQCAAVIHHGGIGTVSWALRTGIPALVVPWAFDQACNAAQVVRLGAGVALSLRRFAPDTASRELDKILSRVSYRQASRALSRILQQEDGAACIADRIGELL